MAERRDFFTAGEPRGKVFFASTRSPEVATVEAAAERGQLGLSGAGGAAAAMHLSQI